MATLAMMPRANQGAWICVSSGLAALILLTYVALPANAQQSTPAATTANNDQLMEIVVTAQKRSESSQTIPIAINAFSAQKLTDAAITDTDSLATIVPGLQFDRVVNSGLPHLRGIGSSNAAPGDESPVALYIDGVYLPSTSGDLFSLNNIADVEVLKGPQGTLYGRNAAGGVISITTKTPSQTPSLDASFGYGNYNQAIESLYGTIGITSNLATDLAVYYQDQMDGWGTNLASGSKTGYSRALDLRNKWLLTLDTTTITLALDYERAITDEGLATRGLYGSKLFNGETYSGNFYNVEQDYHSQGDSKQGGASLTVKHDFDWASLVSISAWRRYTNGVLFDQDSTPLNIVQFDAPSFDHMLSQEIQLLSAPQSRVSWIGGLYYFNDFAGYDPLTIGGAAAQPLAALYSYNREATHSYSAFGQATTEVTTATHVTAGVRYTVDKQALSVNQVFGLPGNIDLLQLPYASSVSYPKTTYRASLDHNFSDAVLGYIEYTRGFKSGVYDLVSASATPIRPEVVDAYELGVKSTFLDNRVRVNASAFLDKVSDLQANKFVAGVGQVLLNAADATIKGGEIEVEAVPVSRLTLRSEISVLHAVFTNFPNDPVSIPAPMGGNIETAVDGDGKYVPNAPKFTISVGGTYKIPTNFGNFDINSTYTHNNGYFFDVGNQLIQPAFSILNSTIVWHAPSQVWDLRFWGKNLLGAKYYSFETTSALGNVGSVAAPLTYGFSVDVHL